jgi:hypothetical protein
MPDLVRQTAMRGRSQSGSDLLAKNLGYFSIALGIAELVAPRRICNAIGLNGLEPVVRSCGAREIATGVAILMSHNPEPWIWARVAGDMADIATVATGLHEDNDKKDNNILALTALAAATALDVVCATSLGAEKGNRQTAVADYTDRSGFPGGVASARGAARTPEAPADQNNSSRPLETERT